MATPSFTADVALLAATRSYRGACAGVPAGGARAIVAQQDYWCADCWCFPNEDCIVLPGGRCKCFRPTEHAEQSSMEMLSR